MVAARYIPPKRPELKRSFGRLRWLAPLMVMIGFGCMTVVGLL